MNQGNSIGMTHGTKWINVFSAFGGVSALAAVLLMVKVYGGLPDKVDEMTRAIRAIDGQGTIGLKVHEADDNRRIKDMERRLDALENIAIDIGPMRTDIKWIRENFERHITKP